MMLTIERRYGTVTVRALVTTSSTERALELSGGKASVFPMETGSYFAPGTAELVDALPSGASEHRAWIAA